MHSLSKAFTKSAFNYSKTILKGSLSTKAFAPAYSIFAKKQFTFNKTLGYFSFPSFSTSSSKETVQQKYKEDLLKVQDHTKEEVEKYEQILEKYISSNDPSAISQEEIPMLLRTYFQLAKVCYDAQGRSSEALDYYNEALNFAERAGVKESKELAYIYNGMGYLYYSEGKEEQVWSCLQKSEKMFETLKLDSEDHEAKYPYVQNIYLQGSLYMGRDQYDKALERFTKALEYTMDLPEAIASPLLIDIYEGLAYLFYKKKDFAKAHEFSINCLNEIDELYGEDDVRAESLSRELALTLYQEGQHEPALKYAEKLHKVLSKNYEKDNVRTVQSLILIGQIQSDLENYSKALESFEKVHEFIQNSPKPAFQDADSLYLTMARAYFFGGKLPEALEFFKRTIQTTIEKYGELDIETANCYFSCGEILELSEITVNEAKVLFKKALDIFEKIDQEKTSTIAVLVKVAELSRRGNAVEESIEFSKKALNLCLTSPQDPLWLEEIYSLLGACYVKMKNYKEGIECFEKTIALCEERDSQSGDLVSHYYLLGNALQVSGDLEKAEEVARKLMRITEEIYGAEHVEAGISAKLLLSILSQRGKKEEVEELIKLYNLKN